MRPELQPGEKQALRDYWALYDAHYEACKAEGTRIAAAMPEFAALVATRTQAQLDEQAALSYKLQKAALIDGDWEPYLARMELEGAAYAQIGISFSSWFELIGRFRRFFLPICLSELKDDPDRMLSTIFGLDILLDIAMCGIGESYLRTKEGAILALNDALEERVASRTAQLAASNMELEAFAYAVSHDLRTPLRAVDGYSQALLEDYGAQIDERGVRYLQRVRAGAQRMDQLIDDLLLLSRVTRSEMQVAALDLSALAAEAIDTLRKADPAREVTVEITPGLVIQGDARLWRTVFANLMGNAWKFTSRRPDARITFGVTTVDDEPTFFIQDNGAGFDMAYASKLFGAFQRLHKATEFEGTGIGLATVQRVVIRHGGRIWAEAAVDAGATFYFQC